MRKTEVDPLETLQDLVKKMGNQQAVARSLNITPQYFSDILRGQRDLSPQIAKKIGLKRIWVKDSDKS